MGANMFASGYIVAEKFQRVEDRGFLGLGAFGVVQLYRHLRTGDLVAIKEIDTLKFKDDPVINRELAALRALPKSRSENLLRVLETCEVHAVARLYIVLEYCNGGDFDEYLRRKGHLHESAVQHFARQLFNGLSVLRTERIVHRDLKPANILVHSLKETSDVCDVEHQYITLKIGDFGSCKKVLERYVYNSPFCGTFLYMAPEVMDRVDGWYIADNTGKADLWSLGLVLYTSLRGQKELTELDSQNILGQSGYGLGDTERALLQQIHSEMQIRPTILPAGSCSANLRSFLVCLLQKDVDRRVAFEILTEHPFLTGEDTGLERFEVIVNPPVGMEYRKLATIYSNALAFNYPASGFSWKLYNHTATFQPEKDETGKYCYGVITSQGLGQWKVKSKLGKHLFCDPFQYYMADMSQMRTIDSTRMIQALNEKQNDTLLEFYKNEAIQRIQEGMGSPLRGYSQQDDLSDSASVKPSLNNFDNLELMRELLSRVPKVFS